MLAVGPLQRIKRLLGRPDLTHAASKPAPIMLPSRHSSIARPHGYLAAAVIAKDEGLYLREWLEFHRLVGIDHVLFYDNDSLDNTKALLEPYVASGYVTYVPWNSFVAGASHQALAYAHALCNFGPQWRWMAFIDLDEFLFPVSEDHLGRVMSEFEDVPAVGVPWYMFTFSGHKERPGGLVIENYLERAQFPPKNKKLFKWKFIVDPSRTTAVKGPHVFHLLEGDSAYDEDRRKILPDNPHAVAVSGMKLRLNHYFTKSEAEFALRKRRGDATGKPADHYMKQGYSQAGLALKHIVRDETILRFLPELRCALELGGEAPQRRPKSANGELGN